MIYQEFHPQPPLDRFVECFWTLESEVSTEQSQPERILPDGCSELILNFGAEFSQHVDGGRTIQPRNFLVGQMTGPILISPTGRVEILGIRFQPGGTFPFFQMPMYEVTDQVIELGALTSRFERDLLQACAGRHSLADRIEALETTLLVYVNSAKQDSWLACLASQIVVSGGMTPIDQLANDAGISSRQLERRFLREVGVGPKLLSRILRFQQVFRAVESNDTAWAAVAVDCGYYDQAHLIRDFNQFSGKTPSVLFSEKAELTESFTRKSRRSNFSNTLA